jgi:hypothetical protein
MDAAQKSVGPYHPLVIVSRFFAGFFGFSMLLGVVISWTRRSKTSEVSLSSLRE